MDLVVFAPVAFKPTAPCIDTTGKLTFIQKKIKYLALQIILQLLVGKQRQTVRGYQLLPLLRSSQLPVNYN